MYDATLDRMIDDVYFFRIANGFYFFEYKNGTVVPLSGLSDTNGITLNNPKFDPTRKDG